MDEIASESMSRQRFPMILLGVFASLALLLASVGICGVVSYSVGQRVHEIGIRMALGAEKGEVLRLVLGQEAKMALVGVVIGLVSAFALARLMVGLLFAVSAHDPLTLVGGAAVLILVALFAGGADMPTVFVGMYAPLASRAQTCQKAARLRHPRAFRARSLASLRMTAKGLE